MYEDHADAGKSSAGGEGGDQDSTDAGGSLPLFRELPIMEPCQATSMTSTCGASGMACDPSPSPDGGADASLSDTLEADMANMAIYDGALGAAGQDVLAMLGGAVSLRFGVLPTPPVSSVSTSHAHIQSDDRFDDVESKFGMLPTPPVSVTSPQLHHYGTNPTQNQSNVAAAAPEDKQVLPEFGNLPPLPPPST
jgi:hypothetical protein